MLPLEERRLCSGTPTMTRTSGPNGGRQWVFPVLEGTLWSAADAPRYSRTKVYLLLTTLLLRVPLSGLCARGGS